MIQKLFFRSQQLSTIKDNSRSLITQIEQIDWNKKQQKPYGESTQRHKPNYSFSPKLPKMIQKLFFRSQQLKTIKDNSRSLITQIEQIDWNKNQQT